MAEINKFYFLRNALTSEGRAPVYLISRCPTERKGRYAEAKLLSKRATIMLT